MPTYHFRCTACAAMSSANLPIGTTDFPECNKCGKPTEKVIKPPMVHFKGSGFYKTDGNKSAEKTEAKPAPAETKKAESAPAPKAKE
jgi:putative FmdB family regulatory protein